MTFFRAASLLLLIPSFSHGFLLPSTATTAVTSASSSSSSSSPTSSSSSSPFPGSDGSSTTSLCSKNSDRARTERILEESMGDDWRHFRAKLVAQETVERGQQQQAAATTNNNGNNNNNNNNNNKKQKNKKTKRSMETSSSSSSSSDDEKQGQLGELFGSVISSIFSSSSSSSSSSNEKGDDWDSIGVPPKDSKEQQQQQEEEVKEQQLLCADPFVSEAELPIHLKPQKGSFLNKHRWAHPISHIEQGCVLIATEKLGGTFHQSVVLVVEHHPKEGTTGLIINRPIDGTLDQVASSLTKDYSVGSSSSSSSSDNKKNKLTSTNPKKEQEKEKATESKIDLSLKLAFRNSPVGFGGPIHQESFHILHGYGEVEGSTKLAPGVFIGGSEELMDQVRVGNFDPQKALFLKGHGEWVGGQLEQEIQKGVWYVASCASDFLLRHAGAPIQEEDNADDLWTDLLVCMGGEHSKVAQKGIGKGDKRKKMP